MANPSDDRFRWDLSVLFETDDAWGRTCDQHETHIDELSFEADVTDDPDALLEALECRDELRALGSRLKVYAHCRSWAAVTDRTARASVRRVERLAARREAALAELESRLREAGRDRVETLLADTGALDAYGHYVDDVFRRGTHALDSVTEVVVSELEEGLDAPSRTLRTLADKAFDPPVVTGSDGEDVQLTESKRLDGLTNPDRAYRRRVYEAYRDALCENREVAAQAYADHLRVHAARASVRGYESPLALSMDDLVPPSVLKGLADDVRDVGTFQRRLERLRTRRDVEELRPWDTRAPLTGEASPEVPYEEAVEFVLDAVAPLGDAYRERLAAFLDEHRVDVYPTEDKRDVPAAMFGEGGTEAFVHLSYERNLESLYLFAHELGHVMHYLLAKEAQPAPYQRLSWHLGELPSFFHEVLLTRHLLESDHVAAGPVLDTVLGRLSPLAAARGFAFSHRVVRDVENDEQLSADDLDGHWRETGREFFAPVTFTETDGHRWLGLNLDRDPFHAVWYLLGRTYALASADRLRSGSLTPETYRQFLRAGESAYPMDLLDVLGLDDGTAEAAGAEYGRLLDVT